MKNLLTLGGLVIVIVGGIHFIPNTLTTEKVVEVEKEVTVNELDKRIEEALANGQASTTEKAQQAYEAVIEAETQRIKDEVKAKYIEEIKGTMSE